MQVVAGFKASAFKSVTRVAFSGSNPELTWKLVLYGFPILFLKVVAYKDAAACTGSARRSVLKGARVERKPSRLLEGSLAVTFTKTLHT